MDEHLRPAASRLNRIAREEGLPLEEILETPSTKEIQESAAEADRGKEREMRALIYDLDARQKALTGRTPEKIEEETGISKQDIFPEGAHVLYVGDPWQRMGIERDTADTVIVDYEFGESAKFVSDDGKFFANLLGSYGEIKKDGPLSDNGSARRFLKRSEFWASNSRAEGTQRNWARELTELVTKALSVSEQVAGTLSAYPHAADTWKNVREYIEKTHHKEIEEAAERLPSHPGDSGNRKDEFSDFRRDAWYQAVDAERGFRDLFDWALIVQPQLEAHRSRLLQEGVSKEEYGREMEKLRTKLIDDVRLRKKPEHALVVKAMFPFLPFENSSFDRLVASWSISAHVFPVMTREEFATCWREIERVLAKDGEAFIFPLDYYYSPNDLAEGEFYETLNEAKKLYDMEWELVDRGQLLTLRLRKMS